MLVMVTKADGTEEAYDVAPTTKLKRCHVNGYWWFTTTSGGQISLSEDVVHEVRLGNVELSEEEKP